MASWKIVALALVSSAFVAFTAASSRGGESPRARCSGFRAGRLDVPTRLRESRSLLAIEAAGSSGAVVLSWLDPLSLRPRSKSLRIAEYHDAWSVAPNERQVALGVSIPARRRVGVVIVDLTSLRITRKIQTGIAAEAIAWLAPRRLAVALQDGTFAVADLGSGRIVRQAHGHGDEPRRAAQIQRRLVVLSADSFTGGPVRLTVVDADGDIRTTTLGRIRLRARMIRGRPYADGAGLVVDPAGHRAYVVVAGAPVATVGLQAMRVSYRRVDALASSSRSRERRRSALWLGNGLFAVYGYDVVAGPAGKDGIVPAGVKLIDSRGFRSCTLDPHASSAAVAGGRLLAYGTRGSRASGLRFYTSTWRPALAALRTPVWDVDVDAAGRLVYARTRAAIHVLDARSGRRLRKIAPGPELVDVIARR